MKFLNILLLIITSSLLLSCGKNNKDKTVEASGNIEAVNVTVSAKTMGEVINIIKDEGSRVNKGDTVMIIDYANLDLQLAQAKASADQAEAQLQLLKSGARKEDIQSAAEQLNQAQANFDAAKSDKIRMSKLFESNSITKKQFEDVQNRYDVSAAQLNASKQNLAKLKTFTRPEDLKQAKANFDRQTAAVNIIKKSINDSYVISPISGIIVKKFVEQGESVTNLSSLFKAADLRKVQLVIYVSEEELGKVKLGQSTEIKTDTYKNKTYNGKVVFISPEAEFTPKNIQTKDERTKLVFAVKIEIDNPDFELKEGMPADATIKL
ncbi:MAG: efflux RND transporter periplasmic adaptor subunit [Bacteroidota bacterium]|nr:efflux RND transporter periplasmic adaptor subunit [Bacteroidota bacterium]